MKTSTLLLLGGAAVVGYLYAQRKAAAAAPAAMQAQALTGAQPTQVNVIVDGDDDYGAGWSWGPAVFGGRRGGGHGHGGHHGGGGHRGGRH